MFSTDIFWDNTTFIFKNFETNCAAEMQQKQ